MEVLRQETVTYANTCPRAVTLAASGPIGLDGLADARFSHEESEQALTAPQRGAAALEPLVRASAP